MEKGKGDRSGSGSTAESSSVGRNSGKARAASSAESKVPSQTLVFLPGSRISAAKRPHGRLRTPRKRVSVPGGGSCAVAGKATACDRPFLDAIAASVAPIGSLASCRFQFGIYRKW
ncbi:hypothetical protein M5K25_026723 [Dendrobium thyrsiflorum]|uniref:Uncharacterized protein n=1 Tax=Dendrobium thyrsiflorum TaxID=117978 RepID=A0ABD0TYF6_DENTH